MDGQQEAWTPVTSYLEPRETDEQRMVLLPGESLEERLRTQRIAQRLAIAKARKLRKKKIARTSSNYRMGDLP